MSKFDEDFYKKIFKGINYLLNNVCEYYIEEGKERGLSPTDTAVLITKAARETAFVKAEKMEDEEEE